MNIPKVKQIIEETALQHEGNIYQLIDAINIAILPALLSMGTPPCSSRVTVDRLITMGYSISDISDAATELFNVETQNP